MPILRKHSRACNSWVNNPIQPKIELDRDFMPVLVICKNECDLKKMKLLEWWQDFSHLKSMGAMCCHGSSSSTPISLKTLCSLSPYLMMLHVKLDQDWPTGCRDILSWKCGRRTTTDPGSCHTNSSLRLRWANSRKIMKRISSMNVFFTEAEKIYQCKPFLNIHEYLVARNGLTPTQKWNRGYLTFSVEDRFLFPRMNTKSSIFTNGGATSENITFYVREWNKNWSYTERVKFSVSFML